MSNPYRRYQVRPSYAYCLAGDWSDSGSGSPVRAEAEARDHADDKGHEVRVATTQERILRPQQAAGAR
jgi:hypothetical protein